MLTRSPQNTLMEVTGKVCIITGSAQGLGKAFAARLLEAGGKVCISDINQDRGEDTLIELRERFGEEMVCFVVCDVTEEEQFRNLFDKTEEFFKVSCVDILVNNAGINQNLGWKKCLYVNLVSVMLGTEIALERMRKEGKSGQIINTASMAGIITGSSKIIPAYSVSKHGVVALTRSLALPTGSVAHKCICPTFADTEIVSSARIDPKIIKENGGLMSPEFVAQGFYHLVTECNSGSVMGVMPNTPYLLIPDISRESITFLVLLAKFGDRMFSLGVVRTKHLLLLLSILAVIFLYFMSIIFAKVNN